MLGAGGGWGGKLEKRGAGLSGYKPHSGKRGRKRDRVSGQSGTLSQSTWSSLSDATGNHTASLQVPLENAALTSGFQCYGALERRKEDWGRGTIRQVRDPGKHQVLSSDPQEKSGWMRAHL